MKLVHGAVQGWPLRPAERWTSHEKWGGKSASRMARQHAPMITWGSIASVAHTHSVRPTHRGCFLPVRYLSVSLANFGGPREQVVLSHSLSYHRQHMFVLFRSCKHMLCIDSACVCTCVSKSPCNILLACPIACLGSRCIGLSFHCDLCATISSSVQKKGEIILHWQTDSLTTVSALTPIEKGPLEVCLFWAKRKSFFMGFLNTTRFLGRN